MSELDTAHERLMRKLDAMPSTGFLYAMTGLTVVGVLGGLAFALWIGFIA